MKTNRWILFAALSLLGGASYAANPKAVSASPRAQLAGRTFAQGIADGEENAANQAATYGYGTQDYQDAIDAQVAYAAFQARNSEEPGYWRGYVNGLQSY